MVKLRRAASVSLSATLMVGMGSGTILNAALANAGPYVGAAMPTHNTFAGHANAGWQLSPHAAASGVNTFAVSNVLHAVPTQTHSATTHITDHNLRPVWSATSGSIFSTPTTAQSTHDLNLSSATALFAANTLAGFHTLTINVGGKQEVVGVNTNLTAAELVAAEQVLSGGKQQLTVNASGIASGGIFNLDKTTVGALDKALGGNIGSLTIGKGVEVIDSLATLNLTGTLNNSGSILVGAAPTAHGQTVDTITASNIYNAAGGSIQSGSILGTLVPTDIALDATTTFSNNGIIHSSGNLTISGASVSNLAASATKPTISAVGNVNLVSSLVNNTGTVSSTSGNVVVGGSAVNNLMVLNSNGTLQAQKGTLEFEVAGNNNSNTITVAGGNLLSKTADFEAGKGALQVNVGQLTGEVEGVACSAHVTADTKTLSLGKLDVTGDPTYYNTGGDIVIDNGFAPTVNASLAIVASGNIIGNGGTLDTSNDVGNGGSLTLIAGANFTTTGGSGNVGPDSTSTVVVTNSTAAGKGSKTGGYIDLSGITLTGSTTNLPVAAVTTAGVGGTGGDVLMVAYKGSGKNSGSIVDTATPTQTSGATVIEASGTGGSGNVTIIAPGAITGQDVNAANVQIASGTPVIGDGSSSAKITIIDGAIQSGSASYGLNNAVAASGAITQANITASGDTNISTAGHFAASSINASTVELNTGFAGTMTAPIVLTNTQTQLAVNSATAKAGVYVRSNNNGNINLISSTLPTTGTLYVEADNDLNVTGNVSAGSMLLGASKGTLSTTGAVASATNLILYAPLGNTNVEISTTNLDLHTIGGTSSSIIIDANSAKTTNITDASFQADNTTVTAKQALKITGTFDIANHDTTTFTYAPATAPTKAAPGVTIATNVNSGMDDIGTLVFSNDNAPLATLVASKSVINTEALTLNWAGPIGSKSAPIFANTSDDFSASSQSSVYLQQAGTGAVHAISTPTSGSTTLSIVGSSLVVNVSLAQAPIVTVSNTDKNAGVVNLVTGGLISDNGAVGGSVTVSSSGNITQADSTAQIVGGKVSLTSTAGDIGSSTSPIDAGSVSGTTALTANAVKGSVVVLDTADVTLAKGTALNTYAVQGKSLTTSTISAPVIDLRTSGGDLTIGGNLGSTKSTTIDVNASGNIITTTKSILLTATTVNIEAGNSVGAPTSKTDGLNTKATTLAVEADNGVAVINNTGTTTVNSLFGADLNINNTGALTVDTSLTTGDSLGLSSTVSVTFSGETNLNVRGISVAAPSIVFATGSVVTAAAGGAALTSTKGLIVSGDGTLNAGDNAQLSGTSIQIGTTTDLHDPINFTATGNTPFFTATSKGNLTLDFAQPITLVNQPDGAQVGTSIQVANIVNLNTAATTPLKITTETSDGSIGNLLTIALSGSNPVTLGDAAGQIQLSAIGTAGAGRDGQVSFSTAGALTLASNPYVVSEGKASVSLQGKTMTLSSDLIDPRVQSLSLAQTGALFDLKNNITVADDGIVTISGSKGVTVESGVTVQGNGVELVGSVLTNNGTITGLGTQPELVLATDSLKSAPLTISNVQTGSFTDFYSAVIQASGGGALNTGNLFTSASLLQDNITSLGIGNTETGKITFSPLVQEIGVTQNGALNITGASIGFTSTTNNPALVLSDSGGNLTVNLNAPITIGTAKGNYDIHGTPFNLILSALGNLTLNEAVAATGTQSVLDATGQILVNAATNFHAADGSAVVTVSTDGTAKTSTVINTAANAITADHITLQRASTTMPSTPTYTNANVVFVQGGALSVSNTYNGEAFVQGTQDPNNTMPVTALTFVNTSTTSTNQLTVEPVVVSNGNLSITENVGNMVLVGLGGQFNFGATNGNVVINATAPTASISLLSGTQLTTTSSKAGLGNITIAVGAIPNPPVAGTAPANAPTPTSKDGGQVFWGTGNLSFTGTNTLNVFGSNTIFSAGSGQIGVGNNLMGNTGGVLIQADPVMSAPQAHFSVTPVQTFSQIENFAAPVATTSSSAANQLAPNSILPFFNQAAFSLSGLAVESTDKVSPTSQSSKLFSGASLFAPDKDTVIDTASGKISIAGGSVVLLLAFDGGVAVYNLHDTKSSAVTLQHGGIKLAVAPGRSVTLTSKHVRFFEEINPVQAAAYRNVRSSCRDSGITTFEADFSHSSILNGVSGMRQFVASKDKQTRKAAGSMLKTAAILNQLSGAGQYQYMNVPAVTASNF